MICCHFCQRPIHYNDDLGTWVHDNPYRPIEEQHIPVPRFTEYRILWEARA